MRRPTISLMLLPRFGRVLLLCFLVAVAGCNSEDEGVEATARPESGGQVLATSTAVVPSVTTSPTTRTQSAVTLAAPDDPPASRTPGAGTNSIKSTSTPGPSALEVVQTQAALIPLPPTHTRTPTPVPTRTPVPTPEPAPIREADLEQALLTLEDMPRGWEESNLGSLEAILSADAESTIYLCHALPNHRQLSVGAEFGDGDLGPHLVHYLDLYDEGDAAADMDAFANAADACDEMVIGMAGGQRTRLQVSPLTFPQLGDETLAVHLSGEPVFLLGRPKGDIIKIREGNIILTLGYFNVGGGGLNTEALEVYSRLALQRLQEVLGEER